MTVFDSVAGHYGRPVLEQEILAALEINQGAVDIDGLAPIDEFHTGGRQATAALTAQLSLRPDSHVLLHVGMNIEDKDTLCAELARVLRPGGTCGIYV